MSHSVGVFVRVCMCVCVLDNLTEDRTCISNLISHGEDNLTEGRTCISNLISHREDNLTEGTTCISRVPHQSGVSQV